MILHNFTYIYPSHWGFALKENPMDILEELLRRGFHHVLDISENWERLKIWTTNLRGAIYAWPLLKGRSSLPLLQAPCCRCARLLWILGSKRLSLAHVLVATSQELPRPNDTLRQPRGEQKKEAPGIFIIEKLRATTVLSFNHYPTIVREKTSWRNVWTIIHSFRGAISRWFVSATEGSTAILVGQMPKFAITGRTEADFWLCIGHDATLMSHCLMLRR